MNSSNSLIYVGALALLIGGGLLYALCFRRKGSRPDGNRRDVQPPRQLPPAPPPVRNPVRNDVVRSTERPAPEREQRPAPEKDPLLKFVKPSQPLGLSSVAIDQAQKRAAQHIAACTAARNLKNIAEARRHLAYAVKEVQDKLRIDHWYSAEVLNMAGCLEYDEGFYLRARDLWERADCIASEWPDQCKDLIPVLEKNLKLVKGTLGF